MISGSSTHSQAVPLRGEISSFWQQGKSRHSITLDKIKVNRFHIVLLIYNFTDKDERDHLFTIRGGNLYCQEDRKNNGKYAHQGNIHLLLVTNELHNTHDGYSTQ